ncbi:MAG: Eco29kI family restriction endonuclease [Thermoguttaceae bacterium]|nr:Eco29kI family restriction endonuclease [Thermoguttaceae bacterium]
MTDEIPVLSPFNPLDKCNLAESVAEAMLERPISKLPPDPFIGAGIYAIYYVGDFPLYRKIAKLNQGQKFAQPIYVWKAVPAGVRKGGFGLGDEPGQALYKRLCDHAKSIEEAKNLAGEFFCGQFSMIDYTLF